MMDLDLGEDESGNKTIGISFPTTNNVINAGSIREPSSLRRSNQSCWNNKKWWVTPLRIGVSFFSLLITFGLMYWLVHWGNKNWET